MDQPHGSSLLQQGSADVYIRGSRDERRAAVNQMMAENREGLGMKVLAILVQRYGVFPKELWDLNSISDMGAARGVTYGVGLSQAMYESIVSNNRYRIVSLTISKDVYHKVELPTTLRRLNILAKEYDRPLDLPGELLDLCIDSDCSYNRPLVLPNKLCKLALLGRRYSQPLTLPPQLVELELGASFAHPLTLPQRLQRLAFTFDSHFNHPLALPPSLRTIQFGMVYNQPTILPLETEAFRVGPAFTHDLSFPNSLRKIEWWCNRPIQIPEGVSEVYFGNSFNKAVTFPSTIRKAVFIGVRYFPRINLPLSLEELTWYPGEYNGLVLPEGLQKLTWGSTSSVRLPLGLKELINARDAPLVLPEGLLKIAFAGLFQRHFTVPASVEEVVCSGRATFTHPTTLQHLILRNSRYEVNLSHNRIHKLTVEDCRVRINKWPQGLKELAFTVDTINYRLRVPTGCRIVGEKRPENAMMD